MKRLIVIIFICVAGTAFSQYPNPLPSGSLSIYDITTWMKAAGEITSTAPASLSSLNSASHLSNHSQPFSISDWYGYSAPSGPPSTPVNTTVYFDIENGQSTFFDGHIHNQGYKGDMGCVKIFDLQTNTQINIKDGGNGIVDDHKNNPPTLDYSNFQMTNRTGQLAITFHDYGIQTNPSPSDYEFGVYMVTAGDVGKYSTLIPGGNALFIVNKSDIIKNGNQLYIKIQKR